jgi:hypothetical protein
LRRVVSRPEILLLPRKKAASLKQVDARDMFKKTSKCVCTSTVMVSHDPFSPTLSTSSVMKTPYKTKENSDDPDPADKGDIQVEYSSDYL